ncbi:MAG TPA: TetR/AcrR family transcriptional regulator [Syntrophales bacterium]|nr:TetR/AcrR family transcriptional regulator [Syntrophales bacterium]
MATEADTFSKLKIREREARKNLIVNAAERSFAGKPFNKVSMRDIAREAGISPASIYRYFPDQQTLFVEAFLRGSRRVIESFRVAVEENSGVSLERIAGEFLDFLIENDPYFRMMTHFMLDGSLSPALVERLNEESRLLIDQFDFLFETMHAKGDRRLLAHAFFSAMNGILITFRDYPGRSREEVIEHMKLVGRVIARLFTLSITSDGWDRGLGVQA